MRILIDKTELKYLYEKGYSTRKIAEYFKCSQNLIIRRMIQYEITRRSSIELVKKYTIDANYFNKIDSPDKAYFLGLLYADGYVNTKLNKIQLSLQEKDLETVENFRKYIGSNSIIRNTKNGNYSQYSLTLYSKKLVGFLCDKGCVEKKSLILKFPTEEQVPSHLIHHFIRGYFDGDGCVSIHLNKLNFSIVGTLDVVTNIKNIIEYECLLNNVKIQKIGNIFKITYGGNNQVKRIYNYLYKDCEDLCMQRKKEKFERVEVQPIIKNKLKKCIIDNCNTKQNCKLLCKFHYNKLINILKTNKRVKLPDGSLKLIKQVREDMNLEKACSLLNIDFSAYELLNSKHF